MFKTSYNSKLIKSRYCFFKINVKDRPDPEEDKECIMGLMNDYLE